MVTQVEGLVVTAVVARLGVPGRVLDRERLEPGRVLM